MKMGIVIVELCQINRAGVKGNEGPLLQSGGPARLRHD